MTSRRQIISYCLAVVAVSLVLRAQSQTPIFRGGTDLVQLDVSVLDKNRQPVRGLRLEDFTLLEDGKPQKLEAFAAVDLPDAVVPTTKWMRDVTPDVTSNELSNHRIIVMILDDQLEDDPWAWKAIRESASNLISQLGPEDMAAVVYTGRSANSQELTNDRMKLMKAVAKFVGSPMHCGPVIGAENIERTTTTLAEAVLPDRRKAIVLFTTGLVTPGFCPSTNCAGDACGSMLDAMRAAQRANINFYPVDVCGLRPPRLPGVGPPGGLPCRAGGLGSLDAFMVLANETGGKAILNTNDFDPGIAQILLENSSYYLLGYRPTNVKEDGTFRRLEVKVNRPDVEVRTRSQYIAPKPPPKPDDKPRPAPPAGVEAIARILPKTDLPLRIALAPFAVPGKDTAAVAVTLGARMPAQTERITEEATLVVRAFAPDGEQRGAADQPITLNLPATRRGVEFARYDLLARIDLKPGRYSLRVSAKSATLDKLGSVYADVDVPDFAKEPLSLSGVALSVTPGVPAAPAEALSAIVPDMPTTEREFARIERVSAFVRAYQGGKAALVPATLATRITDADDRVVVEQTDQLWADRFTTGRAADHRFALPLARLAPGEYLLTFEATAGKLAARRDVRFHVK